MPGHPHDQTPGCHLFKPVRSGFLPFQSCISGAAFWVPALGVDWFTRPQPIWAVNSTFCPFDCLRLSEVHQLCSHLPWIDLHPLCKHSPGAGRTSLTASSPDLGYHTLHYLVSSFGLLWWFNKHFVQLFKKIHLLQGEIGSNYLVGHSQK